MLYNIYFISKCTSKNNKENNNNKPIKISETERKLDIFYMMFLSVLN